MDNIYQHLSSSPILIVLFVVAMVLLLTSLPHFVAQKKTYGSHLQFASTAKKNVALLSILTLIGVTVYCLIPYVEPPTDEIAIVLGNTQNTPQPQISEDISDAIERTMLEHKGEDAFEIADSIKIISATKDPKVIKMDVSQLKLKEIGNNSSNAKRSAKLNVEAIEAMISKATPTDNGANYLEAILKARDNVKDGSKIIVIGSGLSDNGDLNFSKTSVLTDEVSRSDTLSKIQDKYGSNYLENYSIEFYGLGDSVSPQEPLSSKHKEIIRDIYKDTVRSLGGEAVINTKTLVGSSVTTEYIVGTTDTGCGEIGLIFDDSNLKFVGNEAKFTDDAAAKESLATIKVLWDKYKDTILSIHVDGYIAHYPGPDNLSKPRAELVKAALINSGIPSDKILATGKGFGPHKEDTQNRMVKIIINRDSELCEG